MSVNLLCECFCGYLNEWLFSPLPSSLEIQESTPIFRGLQVYGESCRSEPRPPLDEANEGTKQTAGGISEKLIFENATGTEALLKKWSLPEEEITS